MMQGQEKTASLLLVSFLISQGETCKINHIECPPRNRDRAKKGKLLWLFSADSRPPVWLPAW